MVIHSIQELIVMEKIIILHSILNHYQEINFIQLILKLITEFIVI
jgi:hypothetical protein